jgi:hypothetical protein
VGADTLGSSAAPFDENDKSGRVVSAMATKRGRKRMAKA